MIETLDPLPQDRKCFRMVNGVLVERTVKEVLPTLKTNSDGLKQVLEDMLKQYKSKQTELDNWKVSSGWSYEHVHMHEGASSALGHSIPIAWYWPCVLNIYRRRTTFRLCSLEGNLFRIYVLIPSLVRVYGRRFLAFLGMTSKLESLACFTSDRKWIMNSNSAMAEKHARFDALLV